MNNPEPGYGSTRYPEEIKNRYGHDINLARKTRRHKSRDKPFIIGITISLIFLLLCTIFIYYIYSEKDKIANGTYVKYGGMVSDNIGGLDIKAAQDQLEKDMESLTDTKICLSFSSETVNTKLSDLGVKLNYSKYLNDIKHSTYGINVYNSILKHFTTGKVIDVIPSITIDNTVLDKFISLHFEGLDIAPCDAEMYVKNNIVKIKKETSGRILDRQKLSDSIIDAVKNNTDKIIMPVSAISPDITENDLKKQIPSRVISSYNTSFGDSDNGRKTNIKLGASLLNNIILKPGEEFEFWKYVGNPTVERGFRLAAVYQNGKVTTGIGGGLCQVSTTLYNAALLADLKITKRQPHGMPVHYVPLGLDATVDYSSLTLKFANNTGKYLLIKSSTNNNILKFSILGFMPEGETVKVYAKSAGYNEADAYREVYMDGNLIRRDNLGRSKYKSLK